MDAAGMLKTDRSPEDGWMGQLVSLCLLGHGAEPGGCLSSPGWGQRWPAQGWTHGAVPLGPISWPVSTCSSWPKATGGFRGSHLRCGLLHSPGSPIFERDRSPHGGSLNPFQSRSRFSCGGNTSGAAQGLRLERVWPHVPARGQREASGRVPGAAGGRGAWGHRREGPREPGGSWPGGTGFALTFPTSARERRPGLNRCWGLCGNSGNVLFSGFKPVM